MVGRVASIACKSILRYVDRFALAGANNLAMCNFCQAGSYGSASGEWMWMSASGDIEADFLLKSRGSQI